MKRKLICAGILCLGTLLSICLAMLTLQNLGAILSLFVDTSGDQLDFVAIFAQTRDAALSPPWLLPLLLWTGFAAVLYFLPPKVDLASQSSPEDAKMHRRRAIRFDSRSATLKTVLYAVGGTLLFPISYTLTLLLCQVNGVRFLDLLRALVPMLGSL